MRACGWRIGEHGCFSRIKFGVESTLDPGGSWRCTWPGLEGFLAPKTLLGMTSFRMPRNDQYAANDMIVRSSLNPASRCWVSQLRARIRLALRSFGSRIGGFFNRIRYGSASWIELAPEGGPGEFDGSIGPVAGNDQAVDLVDRLGQCALAERVYDAGGAAGAQGVTAQARIAAEEFLVEAAAGEVSLEAVN